MDEQNKDVTNEIEELNDKLEKAYTEAREKSESAEHISNILVGVLVVIVFGFLLGFLIWDIHNDHTIDKQKARIEELEERLNYKTTVEIGPLPCPFCGSELVETMYDRYHGYYIHCEECGSQTGYPYDLLSDDEVTLSEAVNMWNNLDGLEVRDQLEQETEETE